MTPRSALALAGALLALQSAASASDLEFTAVAFPGNSNPAEVAAGDYDGDTFADLVVADGNTDTVRLWSGNGDGTFSADGTFSTGSGQAISCDLVDLDGDGDLDLVTGASNAIISVRHNDGAGNFSLFASFPAALGGIPPDPVDFAFGDVSGDGVLDIVSANFFANSVSIHRAIPGGYAPALSFGLSGVLLRGVGLGDFDEDGDLDIIAGGAGTPFRVLRNDGLGVFTDQTHLGVTGWGATVLDLDGDTHLDVLIAGGIADAVITLYGAGDLTFTAVESGGAFEPLGIVARDLDNDGDLDAAVSTTDSEHVSVLRNDAGALGSVSAWTGHSESFSIASADFDFDGFSDLASLDVVLLNEGPGAWTDVGQALPQNDDLQAVLTGSGPLTGGSTATFDLAYARAATSTFFVLGVSELSAPFKGGVMVPNPDLVVAGLPVDAQGSLAFDLPWPAGIPAGVSFWVQHWFADAGNPGGFAASNAVRGESN